MCFHLLFPTEGSFLCSGGNGPYGRCASTLIVKNCHYYYYYYHHYYYYYYIKGCNKVKQRTIKEKHKSYWAQKMAGYSCRLLFLT